MVRNVEPPLAAPVGSAPTTQELKGAIDSGRTGDKVAFADPGAAPLGTDAEAGGAPASSQEIALALRQELALGLLSKPTGALTARRRPRSPNIQIYRPQLTSVLSILNRITGNMLSACAVVLVIWLIAAATGPGAYGIVQSAIASWVGQVVLFGATFAFFLHLCGGIRHLVWDTVHGFELRSIYISGWAVVAASSILTVAAWVMAAFLKG